MNRARPIIIVILLLGVVALGWYLLRGSDRERMLSGYIEGESPFLAAPVAGTVGTIAAQEGQHVPAGAQLFTIDPATLSAQGEQARAQVTEARTQIAAAEANAEQAEAEATAAAADADKARRDLGRLLSVRREDPAAVLELSEAERAQPVRIAHADDARLVHDHQ